MNQNDPMPRLNRIQSLGAIAAVVGIVGSLAILITGGAEMFFQNYLMAYLFWVGLGLGSLIWLMIHHLTGGRWGFMVRRFLEAGAITLPLLFVLFLPIIIGMGELYVWTDPEYVASHHTVAHKAAYLNAEGFILRSIIYFVIWSGLAYLLYKWSNEQDAAPNGDFGAAVRMRYLSGAGVLLYVITMTLAGVDWAMSVEPEFYSTMYGVILMVGQGLSTLALLVVLLAIFQGTTPFSGVASTDRVHDVGKLMFAFVILWAYVSYGQFVIIWSGNLPEFTPWYIHRSEEGWTTVSVLLILFHFALPFFILLSRPLKRSLGLLRFVALWVLALRLLEIFWLIAPDYYPVFSVGQLVPYLIVNVALGGIWLTALAWVLKKRPLLPTNDMRNDPRAQKGHAHGAL